MSYLKGSVNETCLTFEKSIGLVFSYEKSLN